MKIEIKDLVKGKTAHLLNRGRQYFTYEILMDDNVSRFQFDINVLDKSDVGEEAVFNDTEKAIMLMRWIRRAIQDKTYRITI